MHFDLKAQTRFLANDFVVNFVVKSVSKYGTGLKSQVKVILYHEMSMVCVYVVFAMTGRSFHRNIY